MADRYFDRNGVTAGFGTLTGAWDTTTASWSTSNAGTATPAAFTFTTADAAFFGSSAVASTTAGTATIAAALNVNINSIRTANLPGRQTIAANAGGKLTMGGASPSFDTAGAGGLTVSAPIEGTAGFTKTGAGDLQLTGANAVTGTVTASVGSLVVGSYNSGTPNNIDSVDAVVTNSATFFWGASAHTFAKSFSGSGTIGTNNPNTLTLSNDASVAGFIGTFNPTCDNTVSGRMRLNAFPSLASAIALQTYTTGATSGTATLALHHGSSSSTSSIVYVFAANASTGGICVLEDNGTAGSTFNGVVTNQPGSNASASLRLRLQGTNSLATYAGQIQATNASGKLSITKDGTGTWTLTGNNVYDGNTNISGGTLSAQSATALGNATAPLGVSINGSAVLELAGNITLNKSNTDFTLNNSNNPIQSVGSNTLQSKLISLAATTTFSVSSGNTLTLSPQGSGVIQGAHGITKTGDGELELTAKANTFSGTVTVSAGTLTVGSVGNATPSPVAAAWGQASSAVLVSGTLKYNGGAGSSNRAVQMTGSAPAVDASGSGALTLSNVTQDTTAKTMTLRGTNTDANTVTNAIANNSGAVSLAKLDGGKWVLSGALSYTGTTTVSGGTLRLETANSNTTSGAVTIGASGTVELITDTLASSGATAGEVLGTGNVTVNGGTIKTRGGATQKGQVRYGGNLTFGSGSTLYIGAAA